MNEITPGIGTKPFKLYLYSEWFKKGDILETIIEYKIQVLSKPKSSWWRYILYCISFHKIDIRKIYYKVKLIK